jgi:putative ABC transport system ATP-binding protein
MITLENIYHSYKNSSFQLSVKNLHIAKNEIVALIGASGSGKSTILRLISGELQATSGKVSVANYELSSSTQHQINQFRLLNIGIFSQINNLLDYLTVKDNILLIKKIDKKFNLNPQLEKIINQVGLTHLMNRFPNQLSEGEKQRVALCRTLSGNSPLIIADEPTSHLDSMNSQLITELLIANCREQNRTLLMVTHDLNLLKFFDRTIDLKSLSEVK